MATSTKKKQSVADWMEKNGLTSFAFAAAIGYTPGAVSKWRQELAYPLDRALKEIAAVGRKKGWTEFPGRPS